VFARRGHREGEKLTCNVIAVGAKRCSVELGGYDIQLTQRDLSYTAIPDLRERYRPGQELACVLKSYDADSGKLLISVKDVNPNPFVGADRRHPVGSRRQAVISGKYGGGVFCTLPDDTTCLCHYSAQHSDADFSSGDGVIILIRQYDYGRQLIYGKILAKW
jgi:ribosomal protein S1